MTLPKTVAKTTARSVAKIVVLAFAALYAAGLSDAASAQKYQGIMVEEGRPAPKTKGGAGKRGVRKPAPAAPRARTPSATPDAERTAEKPAPRKRPRGSSTYIPPPVPSPSGPPPIAQPSTPVYTPPRIDSYGDRATRCLHSFPLAGGLGNNPTDRDSFVRQCAN